jgi:hypothetical protein
MNASVPATSRLSSRRRLPWRIIVLSALVAIWQVDLQHRVGKTPKYPMDASVGLYPELRAEIWAYFYYGVYPVCTAGDWPLSAAHADYVLSHHGDLLAMDLNLPASMVRHGDFGRLWLIMYPVWMSGDPFQQSVVQLDASLFIMALLAVLWAFWAQDRLLLGCLIVLLVGSDPFQREQVMQENIFSLPITFALFALAVNIGWVTGNIRWKTAVCVALISGIALATARDIRAEAAMSIVALPIVYLTVPRVAWSRRWALVGILIGSYVTTSVGWNLFWNHKVAQAQQWVADHGGHPYYGYRTNHHTLWHVLWEGMGDFDTRFGYAWDDRKAFAYAAPILRSAYGLNITYTKGYHSDQMYPDGYYWISLEDLPEYTALMRNTVLHDVTHHPIWYAKILLKRIRAILCDCVPVTVAVLRWTVHDPFRVYLIPLAWPFLIWRRKWAELKIILISLTLSLTPLLIYSGGGTIYWSIFHLVTIAILIDWAIRVAAYYNPIHGRRTAH